MVCAMAEDIIVMTTRPTKLQIAAMMIALRLLIARVETAVAIAFGASVAPFTIITPMLRMAIKRSIGFEASPPKNTLNSNI